MISETTVWDAVILDMQARDKLGRERYGRPLKPFNGRNSLQDAYEEALDLAVYLKQLLIEQKIIIREIENHRAKQEAVR